MVLRLAVCAAYIAGTVAPAPQCVVTVCRMSAGHSMHLILQTLPLMYAMHEGFGVWG